MSHKEVYEFPAAMLPGDRKVKTWVGEGFKEFVVRRPRVGIYVFRGEGFYAEAVREAEPQEREEVFKDNPVVNCITSMYDEDQSLWYCHPANLNQPMASQMGFPAPLYFQTEKISLLQPIKAWAVRRWRRRVLVFKEVNYRYPTENLDRMRDRVEQPFSNPFGTPEEWRAYTFAVDRFTPRLERLVREALRFVGAEFVGLQDIGHGQYRVSYSFAGQEDHVKINDRLICLSSGICLNGHDSDFDLGSVVLVKHRREGW